MWRIFTGLLASFTLIAACGRSPGGPLAQSPECVERFDADRDYFPDKVQPEFAKNFSVEYHGAYKVVTVRRPADGPGEEPFVLLQCGAPVPALTGVLASAPVITIPVHSLFSAVSTHMPLLVDLDHVDALSGVALARYITNESILKRIEDGLVVEYAPNDVINTELVILKKPSMVMSSGGYTEAYDALRKAGIAVVPAVEWQESSALARAEWLKFMALFLNEEKKANTQFRDVRDRYMALKERATKIPEKDRPRVMTGSVYRGMFDIAGGASYAAGLIADAGAVYVWADNPAQGGISVDMESQIARASNADFWINGGDWRSLKEMLAEEPRYAQFRAFRHGNVWLYNRVVGAHGGYDYWSRGLTRPDLILGDLIKIFHPELAADHEFVWYKQVPAE